MLSNHSFSAMACASEFVASVGSPPLWQTAVLDRPWIGALVAVAIGFVVGVFVNRAGRGKLAAIIIGIGLLGAGVIVALGTLITTPEAMLRERTELFVDAIASAKPDALETMLAPRFVIASQGAPDLDLGSDWLIGVAGGMERAISSNDTTVVGVELQGRNAAVVEFRCRTVLIDEARPVGSTWEVQWQRFEGSGADSWKVVRLEAQTIIGQDAARLWIHWGNRYRFGR